MSDPSKVVLEAALSKLDDTPKSTSMIWKSLNCWARETVKMALDQLAEEGKAIRTSEPYQGNGVRHVYKRADITASPKG